MGSVTLGPQAKSQPGQLCSPQPHSMGSGGVGGSVLSSSGSPALLDSRTTQDVAPSPETFTTSLFLRTQSLPSLSQ